VITIVHRAQSNPFDVDVANTRFGQPRQQFIELSLSLNRQRVADSLKLTPEKCVGSSPGSIEIAMQTMLAI
jgi:hypothetical protein